MNATLASRVVVSAVIGERASYRHEVARVLRRKGLEIRERKHQPESAWGVPGWSSCTWADKRAIWARAGLKGAGRGGTALSRLPERRASRPQEVSPEISSKPSRLDHCHEMFSLLPTS
jgi:hypothetical protein